MQGIDIKFCLQCGAEGVMVEEVTPSTIVKLYCPDCGMMAKVSSRTTALCRFRVTQTICSLTLLGVGS